MFPMLIYCDWCNKIKFPISYKDGDGMSEGSRELMTRSVRNYFVKTIVKAIMTTLLLVVLYINLRHYRPGAIDGLVLSGMLIVIWRFVRALVNMDKRRFLLCYYCLGLGHFSSISFEDDRYHIICRCGHTWRVRNHDFMEVLLRTRCRIRG